MRAYLRLDPHLADNKADYPDGAYRAFIECLCFAEQQPERGYFRNEKLLRVLLAKRGRWVPYLLAQGDLSTTPDGRVYVEGWMEWQEGDYQVAERMRRIRQKQGLPVPDRSPGARRTANYRLRSRVFERDHHTCRYCGATDYPREWLVMEHVIPDGPTDEENLVTACRPCNKLKGNRTPDQAGMVLRDVSRDASLSPVTPSSGSGSGSGRHLAEAVGAAPSRAANGQGPPTGSFMGYRPKPGSHEGQHPNCDVCEPLRPKVTP